MTREGVITAEQIVAFASDFDPQLFHLDAEAPKDILFAGLAASGWHTATRPDDVLHVEAVILAIKPSRGRVDRAMVTLRSETKTTGGEIRQIFTAPLVVFRRP